MLFLRKEQCILMSNEHALYGVIISCAQMYAGVNGVTELWPKNLTIVEIWPYNFTVSDL